MSRYLYKLRKFLLYRVLHADDTPHTVALGVALAVVVAFLPLVGFQTVIAVGLAALLRANKAVCVPIVWITNPFTLVPIYGACWKFGHWITASPASEPAAVALSTFEQPYRSAPFFSLEFWKEQLNALVGVGVELWVGCIVVGVVLAGISYLLSRKGVTAYRERRRVKLLRRSLHTSQLRQPAG